MAKRFEVEAYRLLLSIQYEGPFERVQLLMLRRRLYPLADLFEWFDRRWRESYVRTRTKPDVRWKRRTKKDET